MVVTLKLHQIQHTVNGTVPNDLSQCLVFEQPGVVRLTHRIKELEHEKALQKKQMRSVGTCARSSGGNGKVGVAVLRDVVSASMVDVALVTVLHSAKQSQHPCIHTVVTATLLVPLFTLHVVVLRQ